MELTRDRGRCSLVRRNRIARRLPGTSAPRQSALAGNHCSGRIPEMRYRLRTLLIVLALGPPVLAGAWWLWRTAGPLILFLGFFTSPVLFWFGLVDPVARCLEKSEA